MLVDHLRPGKVSTAHTQQPPLNLTTKCSHLSAATSFTASTTRSKHEREEKKLFTQPYGVMKYSVFEAPCPRLLQQEPERQQEGEDAHPAAAAAAAAAGGTEEV